MSKTDINPLGSAIQIFKQYQKLGLDAMNQLDTDGINWSPEPESNSIAVIVKHLHGNMKSRWTDFLITDGEKPWRERDAEFVSDKPSKEFVLNQYNEGWDILYNALRPLVQTDLSKIITIRTEEHSVLEAINRQIAHYSYHVGQIVYLAKAVQSESWKSLSIPKNKSGEFNKEMKHL
ncbi:MAG: DUF1572 domain-containing protein [Bacteroidia bacterium]|nr:DUF1572 domain-containing protein [Bacteroidia bacterium]MCF8428177.1 DUF1572 domain-containing protein [Bacteroidia bacterium]MCF8445441.1 DUF1572 domain-containing protein [Bacteroidia bacterium]